MAVPENERHKSKFLNLRTFSMFRMFRNPRGDYDISADIKNKDVLFTTWKVICWNWVYLTASIAKT
jgi:hypothetical protein